jgi:peroxiredoxin (alkyl hydroperoxide reductase subunit C)
MQTSDANGVATPEGWKPGNDVIVPPPKTGAPGTGALLRVQVPP